MWVRLDRPAVFQSVFAEDFHNYIAYKRAQGIKFEAGASALTLFDRFLFESDVKEPILTKEIAESYTLLIPSEKITTQQTRLCCVRQLALYLQKIGKTTYMPSPQKYLVPNDFVPYIFTHRQMERLFCNADIFPVCAYNPNKHIIVPVLLRMLYGCGLRISEAMNLCVEDVDLENGVLRILDAKFEKDRLVPVTPSQLEIYRNYYNQIHANNNHKYFFPGCFKEKMDKQTFYWAFRELLGQIGIKHMGKGRGPRVHDLRHTFAVHSLESLVQQGLDIYTTFPILATYLGHKNISATGKYLRLTTELFPQITKAVENACNIIFPEVLEDEAC